LPVRTSRGTGNVSGFGTERLFESVQEHSFLYDGKDKKDRNRDIVQKAWEHIGMEMRCAIIAAIIV
jgi:hypothetical protein